MTPTIRVDVDCETLPQPVVVIITVESCDGSVFMADKTLRACPPSPVYWTPPVAPPFSVTAYTFAGLGLPLVDVESAGYGCP